ncbi:hypothetical protein KFL_000390020 [Klebsormidium nitens]|uniref:Uncharacterized protein n=1 Tax=Klebsormidium nitens TaxID=105231 RepID=A0A1Y1HMI1_KLENI|nr:hypothetical protein KFL_000390020 [Klebsormidium nitens]|eukprot:GAQ79814.1 hypothetical protein KFL_000390020 [Klebsormidium nitens]
MAALSEVEQRKLAIGLYECERWHHSGEDPAQGNAPEHVKEAWRSLERAKKQVDTSRWLVEAFSRRRAERFLPSVKKPLPDGDKLDVLGAVSGHLRCSPLAPADAAEMVTWEAAQELVKMKERIDRDSLELVGIYEQIWHLENTRKFWEQWELAQEVSAGLDQVAANVQEYRRVQNIFNQELTDWRRAHAKMIRPWDIFVKRLPAATPGESLEAPSVAEYIKWSVGTREYRSDPDNAWAVGHIASTEVAGEAWRSAYEDDPQKMAVYEERLAQQKFAEKLWAATRVQLLGYVNTSQAETAGGRMQEPAGGPQGFDEAHQNG